MLGFESRSWRWRVPRFWPGRPSGFSIRGAAAWLDAFDEYLDANPVRPISGESRSYFAFSGDRPPEETFKALGLEQVVLTKHL
jgi:hypothetical protein